jgi:aminoglycoside phosphotransferase (APT) family kinase protein
MSSARLETNMDLTELNDRLVTFARGMTGDPAARVSNVSKTSGHAGFSYFFDLEANGQSRSLFLRLPPPGVKLEGTADVLRQVAVLNALEGTDVPHASVVWSGDDPRWFGLPYFITDRLPGDVLRGDHLLKFDADERREMARQAMTAVAGIHRVDPAKVSYLGDFWGFEFDVTRWDRFYERAADQHLLAQAPTVRQRLLDTIPHDARIGLYHGDFQWANLLYSDDALLQAVIDWELCGIGATLNDVGWICAFNEPRAWAHEGATGGGLMPQADELEAMYRDAWGENAGDIRWFKALAVYKFGIITGFNLMLHRRGKRDDPHWEDIAPSMETNMAYAMEMLG